VNEFFLEEDQKVAVANLTLTPEEEAQLEVARAWAETGSAYAYEHGTRPATLALTLMTSPVAMLAW